MKALDFFCGVGGMTRGLLDAGIEVVAGYDNDEHCEPTYRRNNKGVAFHLADVRDLTAQGLQMAKGGVWLFAACAPCQPFSAQRKAGGLVRDATLLAELGRLVRSAHPAYVLMENVPGMARVPGFSTFRRFLKTLADSGYRYVYRVLDAKHYGVPQSRRRLVLLASRKGEPCLPSATHGLGRRRVRTVREAIGHMPAIGAGQAHDKMANHVAASIAEQNLTRLRNTPVDGGDRRSWPEELTLACHRRTKGYTDVYGRMAWDRPAPTLTGKCNSISNGRYGHPEQDRAISLREAAAIQTFPDNYEFEGLISHIAKHIGNAVPVAFASILGRHVLALDRDLA